MNTPLFLISCSVMFGCLFGFLVASIMSAHRVARANREGWKEATRFYARRDRANQEREELQ